MSQPTWTTNQQLGSYPSLIGLSIQLVAVPQPPAVTLSYTLISGNLPGGITISTSGLVSGIPELISEDTQFTFVVRVTDNLGNIKDRTFTMTISGVAIPQLTPVPGSIVNEQDSTWIEQQIPYTNPISDNKIQIRVLQGQVPPGLEINSSGLIRGYAEPPIINLNLSEITTQTVAINNNQVICLSTTGFRVGRPIVFSSDIGGIIENVTYFIRSVINQTTFTLSATVDGPQLLLTNTVATVDITLPAVTVGQPTTQTYTFTVQLDSPLGGNTENYSITITNQNLTDPSIKRQPTILNTRPLTYNIQSLSDFGYYLLPPDGNGTTYPPSSTVFIEKIQSDNKFYFRILGKDFDDDKLIYQYNNLPLDFVGDPDTGWIIGDPEITANTISLYSFSVLVYKEDDPTITSDTFNFSVIVYNDLEGNIVWLTESDLGTVENGSESLLSVMAISDTPLEYRLLSGTLPPNLDLSTNGNIIGTIAYQPTDQQLPKNSDSLFSFVIEAYSPDWSIVSSTRTFTLTVTQEYEQPTDTLYIKCTPDINDRDIITDLLNNPLLIPPEVLYRSDDMNFGKAKDVTYAHAYGIYASNIDEYIAAITKNHYWRNITLGEIKTAIARDDSGNIIYEVVYSSIIDNLVNPTNVSVSKEIQWPRPIELPLNQGIIQTVYPNSLDNMRQQVGQVLGQEFNFRLYPKWMISQQQNGSTLGFTPAWVICYTKIPKPVHSIVVETYETDNTIELSSTDGIFVGGKIVFNGSDNISGLQSNKEYYVIEVKQDQKTIKISTDVNGNSIKLKNSTQNIDAVYEAISYANIIKNNIENNWLTPPGDPIILNEINFKIDRFFVDKYLTYNYDISTETWQSLPSATPPPDPRDSEDFYVLFPQENILPKEPY